jgi:ABC-type transport system involved in multi-copper enzyme maturation permease subunit
MTGILDIARLELTMRVRAGRWRWLLGAWFLVLTLFMLLARTSLSDNTGAVSSHQRGTVLYGGLQLFMLGLALLVTPTLSSQSVNGDRERGTLAVLQVTRLSAFQIAAGKLLSAWATTAAFLLVSAPLVVWAMIEGGVSFARVVTVTLVMLLLLGVICAIALGLSSLLARSTTSSVLSYLAVFALTVGTLILFGLVTASTTDSSGARTDRTWWLLAPNPFVVLADAAPVAHKPRAVCQATGATTFCSTPSQSLDPLGALGRTVRDLRKPPSQGFIVNIGPGGTTEIPREQHGGLVWPYGLGFDLALGGFMLWTTTRRLQTPRSYLPRGVRIA